MFSRRIFYFFLLFISGYSLFPPAAISLADTTHNLNVSLFVLPHPADYQFAFSSTDEETLANQDTILSYQILYGAKESAGSDVPITLVADFSNDTASGLDVLDYVSGSATNGYDTTVPVVDLVHKTITWTISSLPAGATDQVVAFQLETNSNYRQTDVIPFTVTASMTGQVDQSVAQSYQYIAPPVTPGLTTPAPQLTPTPSVTISHPTPTPPISVPSPGLTFLNVAVRELTSQSLSLAVETNKQTKLQVFYGTAIGNLSQSVTSLSYDANHTIDITNLLPQTTYFVKISASDKSGISKTSDIYTFTTATNSQELQIVANSLSISSSGIVLNNANELGGKQNIIIPQNSPYAFTFQVSRSNLIKNIQIVIRNKYVIGVNSTQTQDPENQYVALTETTNGVFVGQFKTPPSAGVYEVFVRIADESGNITEQAIADLNVTQPLLVKSKKTDQPLEDAQILLFYKDPRVGKFVILSPDAFPINNPSYTDLYGQVSVTLPEGTYQAKVTALGYTQQNVTFTIGNLPGETYPTIYMIENPLDISAATTYYRTIAVDMIQQTKLFVQDTAINTPLFELNALLIIAFLIILTLFSFSKRSYIPLRSLPDYLHHIWMVYFIKKKSIDTMKGRVFDKETGKNVASCTVYLIDKNKQSVIGHTATDKNGCFAFTKIPLLTYTLEIVKEGYEIIVFHESELEQVDQDGYVLGLSKKQVTLSLLQETRFVFRNILSMLFETLLILTFAFELFLGYALGFDKVFIFMVFSAVNFILWLIHIIHLRNERNIF